MTILGIGVDIIHVPRISALLKRPYASRFVKRILSPSERVQWDAVARSEEEQARFLAVRWSVKEAAYKALYPTVKATWKDLAYQSYANGQKPTLVFTETLEADKGSKVGPIHVSVSHDGEYVVSQVLVEAHK